MYYSAEEILMIVKGIIEYEGIKKAIEWLEGEDYTPEQIQDVLDHI